MKISPQNSATGILFVATSPGEKDLSWSSFMRNDKVGRYKYLQNRRATLLRELQEYFIRISEEKLE